MAEVVDLASVGVKLPGGRANGNGEAFDAYASIVALNWTTLKNMATSAKLCRFRADNPEPDKDSFRIGRMLHVAALEPERWASEYVVEPDFGEQVTAKGELATNPKATKGYKSARAQWLAGLTPGAQVAAPEEHALVERCAKAIRSHRVAGPLLRAGRFERVVQWTDEQTGVACKARLDFVDRCVVDLKGTRQPSVRRFLRDSAEYLYYGQTAWYHDAAIAAGELPPDADYPIVIGIQTCEPFDVMPLRMTDATLEAGRNLYRTLLNRYVECRAAGWWPGLAEDFVPWDLPRYAAGVEDQSGLADGDPW